MGWQAEKERSSLEKASLEQEQSLIKHRAAESIRVQIRSKATQSTWQAKHEIEYSAGSGFA
jgi:hypothetical protein